MDCVTCLLVGMCMLCGQNLEAANSGRPMTREEVDTALQSALRQLNSNVVSSSSSYLRQSKLDPRFSHMGIGKRYGAKLDPYNFVVGLGKRYGAKLDPYNFVVGLGKRAQAPPDDQSDVPVLDDPESMRDASTSYTRLSSLGGSNRFGFTPTAQEASDSYTDTSPVIVTDSDRPRKVSDSHRWQSSNSETRKLRLRRMQLRLQPTVGR